MNDSEGEIQDLKEIVKSEKSNPSVLFHVGVTYQKLGNYEKSIEVLSLGIRINSAEKEEAGQEIRPQNNFISNTSLSNIYFERAIAYENACADLKNSM